MWYQLITVMAGYCYWVSAYHHNHHQPTAPRIIEHPVDTTVAREDPATLNCHAVGNPEPNYTWYKDGTPLITSQKDLYVNRVVLHNGNLFFLHVVQSRKESDGGVYWCEAENGSGKVVSRNATLTVAVLRNEFRLEPQNVKVPAGQDAVLECSPPRGTPEPQVFWLKDGQSIKMGGRIHHLGDSSHNLVINHVKLSDDGRYQCVARNAAGTRESTTAILKVFVEPFLIRPPGDITALVGATVDFPCIVGGEPPPDVLWRRHSPGGPLPLDRIHANDATTLRLEKILISDQGRYICEAENEGGKITAAAQLTVYAAPTFLVRPQVQNVDIGSNISLTCIVEGSPKPFVFWTVEGENNLIYPGTPLRRFRASTTLKGTSILSLNNAQLSDSGTTVICSAVNAAGACSSHVKLTILSKSDRPPPVIIRGPVNQTLPIDSTAILVCDAIGTPEPTISWYKNGIPFIPIADKVKQMNKGTVMEIYNLNKNDSGRFMCLASSRTGKTSWTGVLNVDNPKNPNINFFKAPEAVMLPGPPSQPHIVNKTSNSVTLTWGQNQKIGSSGLLGYQIEIFQRQMNATPTWMVLAQRVLDPVYTTRNLLQSDVPYKFLVRAENGHGLGPPSQLSDTVILSSNSTNTKLVTNNDRIMLNEARLSLFSGRVLRLIEAIPVLSTAVTLEWELMDFNYVEGIYIYYIGLEGGTNIPTTHNVINIVNTKGVTTHTVNNLGRWSRYEFFLVPHYRNVLGQPSNSRTIRTLEDIPLEPPVHMEALLLNSSAVYLKWKPPAANALNGELQGYRVEIKVNGSSTELGDVINVGPETPTLLLGNLTAGIAYTVRIAALTRAGVGPYSPAALMRLDPSTIDDKIQRPLDMHPGDFITETWFVILLISMVAVMVVLFGTIVLVRRRQLNRQKLTKSSVTSRSNGGVLSTATKLETPLWLDQEPCTLVPPAYSKIMDAATNNVNLHSNPMYTPPINQNYQSLIDSKYHEYSSLHQDYASPHPNADYAEVEQPLVLRSGASSPAPYATTTLVTSGRRSGQSMMWSPEESPYPAANGGYYNRKVYSDSYFGGTQTLRRSNAKICSRSDGVYARIGTTRSSGGSPQLSSFTPTRQVYHSNSGDPPPSVNL